MSGNNLPWDFYLTAAEHSGNVGARVARAPTGSLDAALPSRRSNDCPKRVREVDGKEPGRTSIVTELDEGWKVKIKRTPRDRKLSKREAARQYARERRKQNAAVRQGLVEARERGAQANHRPRLQGGDDGV